MNTKLKDTPHPQWPWISSALFYDDAAAAIDWLCKAFGFEVRIKMVGEAGNIEHSELTYEGGVIMVASSGSGDARAHFRSPRSLDGANTQSLCVYVDDVDAHSTQARAAGATIVNEPKTDDHGEDYGAIRSYQARDLEGHCFWFMQVVRGPKTT